ncbi:MAG: hypothetical protein COC05_02770 [Gammaproteobacteria bacterium]|nr:WHG domain-containing protein [Beggiatoa alba]PCH60938.1 MAG: hypothetical protein COC05_02770 [Gammaproteobacteria bacterium]
MARRNDHSRKQIRELAIQAVLDVVDSDEDATITARSVAKGMGYTVGTLYLVFRNLDDLLLQVNSKLLQHLYGDMNVVAQNSEGPRDTIFELAKCYVSFAEDHPGRWQLLSHRRDNTLGHDAVENEADNIVEDIFVLVQTELTRLAPTRDSKEIAIAARALWSAIHGICIVTASSHLRRRAHYDARLLVHTLVHTYLSGFMFDKIESLAPRS